MLSVILYGRNDNHGYNYHKRLAISLNCLAQALTHDSDEIVFVDYNSPEDLPTIIEAIADTLTEKAKTLLKIYRLRQTSSIDKNSALPSEPLCRNVAIRRSNPKNRWILSTNVDMIFLPSCPKKNVSTLIEDLPEGFYELPRFEIPENMWESQFDRLKPEKTLSFLRQHALKMHLNTIIRRPDFLFYDNPGDFQLMRRKVIFEIDGFDEQMRKGWHVDSNLCKRMSLYYQGNIRSLEGKLWGYHCNHTRQKNLSPKKNGAENDWNTYVKEVKEPFISKQRESWGLAKEVIEKISLQEPLTLSFFKKTRSPSEFSINQDTFNTLTYDSAPIFTHLADHFHHLPPNSQVVYIGHNQQLLKQIQEIIPNVLTDGSLIDLYKKGALIIFDFGLDQNEFNGDAINPSHQLYNNLKGKLKDVMEKFLQIIRLEKEHQREIKLIGINVLFTDFRALFHRHLSMRKTTFLTGISFGYLKKKRRLFQIGKKELKLYLMYLAVRYFYSFTDQLREKTYQTPLLNKLFQLK